jgi:S-DNA-T family DNA segregation ATPase FtsK/SpoIIIE
MGFKIIIGNCFIAINNPDNRIICNNKKLFPWTKQEIIKPDEEDDEIEIDNSSYFYRSPRFKRDVETAKFTIDPPPQENNNDEVPLILMLGPSVTMGMASMTTGIFAVNNAMQNGNISQALPTVVMSMSMLLGTILWPILAKRFEKKRKIERESKRQAKYKEYLHKMDETIKLECIHQSEILHENHIKIEDCIDRIRNVKRNLWERSIGQNDFLKIRLGLGDLPLDADIKYSERKFTLDDDNLQEEQFNLCEAPKKLSKVPVTVSLFDDYISGVIGDRAEMLSFAKGMIFQLATLHSYDELKLLFIFDEKEDNEFEFVKWLPHIWNNEKTIRFMATNNNEVKEISAYIEKEIEARIELNDNDLTDVTTYYVIFALSKALANRAEMIKQVLSKKNNLGISVVAFYDVINNLPKECSTVIELSDVNSKVFDKNDISGKFTSFAPDIHLNKQSEELAVRLANIQLDTLASVYKLPAMLTFLEMFGVGKVEHLNSATRWKENDPTITLETEVGVDTLGETFKLDLHEKFHGPHGLVAGMTGSGKSEFIITYILSMAVNYHPYEVAFILIDYKGGGMAKSFENLPHTAGVITNLDGAAVKRSLISIQSELKRRQAIFNEAGKKVNVSNIDIYKYQKLYREGTVDEPLQHLFIISDEFAELKTQQPEFMAQLVSAARIGRSLGVHLILATQKPSGVVDDQIWSNSKFRVCLKVQEKADSMDMLKRPDAAELSQTGRFYLQVGYNELFELGQSAWAGAPYYPADKVLVEKDSSVVVIDKIGRIIKSAKIDKKKHLDPNPKKQLDSITNYLKQIAEEENIKIRPLWLPSIEPMIFVDDLKQKYSVTKSKSCYLKPVVGEYDDPARQRQCIMYLPLSDEGNTIIYGVAGSGKTTFLTTLVYSLMEEHTPEEVNIYILDFSSETLRAFVRAPHVGDVVLSHESEKVSNLFKMLHNEIETRKKLFSLFGGDYQSYINAGEKILPNIVVMINNFAAFSEIYAESEDDISNLTREGTKYGIYFVLTVSNTNAVRYRLLQNFKQLMVMQLNDQSDYSGVLGSTDGLYPSKMKGRGIFKTDGVYEFQTAYIINDNINAFMLSYSEKKAIDYLGKTAKKIPILPQVVDIEFMTNYLSPDDKAILPIGVNKNTLDVENYSFEKSPVNIVLSRDNEKCYFIQSLAVLASLKTKSKITVFDLMSIFDVGFNKDIDYINDNSNYEGSVIELFDLLVYRNNSYKDAKEQGKSMPIFDKRIVIINSLYELKLHLSDDAKEKLSLILERAECEYNVTIIISDTASNMAGIGSEAWYKKQINADSGIWLGDGVADQYVIKISKITNVLYGEIGDDFGYVITKGKPKLVKLLTSKAGEHHE